ncbi:MAG: hypothetical protein Unbinned400contig1004_10 [Prokaryotic dsDNA virus sp.]|nr:MAG: hypothetical protein Unbinned400contig1004_10 [Prokaryotic dsDNA virus sp.]
MKRAVVISDQHFPLVDDKALSVLLQGIQIIKPDIAINLGDVGEWESVSAWRWKRRKCPPLEYQLPFIDEEIELVNEGLDKIDRALDKVKCKTRYMLQGNHDEWLDMFVEKFPYLKGYTFRKACLLDERGYKYYEHNKPLKLGKINFIHGAYATTYHAKKHLEAYGSNICYGHTHDVQRHTLTKLDSGTIAAWSMGCLKNMSGDKNKWLRGRLHNWCHAFGIITWQSNGNFQIEVIDIQKGKASVWGQEIVAN